MKEILNQLFEHKPLSRAQSERLLHDMASGMCNSSQVTALLVVYLMRPITVEELEGFRTALLDLCLRVDLTGYETIDLCGTGGDGRNTFNISTLASFVAAGAGIKVAKHGNYGVSSVSGSSNVMEYLGYRFTNDTSELRRQMDECGICFMHAPLFHPALKAAAASRKELGMRTFFNMLGPLVNPSFPKYQLTGVFNLELLRMYQYLLQQTDRRYMLVHSLDGYDELSLTSDFKLVSPERAQSLSPHQIGMPTYRQEELYGGLDISSSARLFMQILNGEGTTAQNDVVCANAGLAVQCVSSDLSLKDAIGIARESLASKSALNVFKKLVS